MEDRIIVKFDNGVEMQFATLTRRLYGYIFDDVVDDARHGDRGHAVICIDGVAVHHVEAFNCGGYVYSYVDEYPLRVFKA